MGLGYGHKNCRLGGCVGQITADPEEFNIRMLGEASSQEPAPQSNSSLKEASQMELPPYQWHMKGMMMIMIHPLYIA